MKRNKLVIIILILAGIVLSSCSRAYQPANIQKRKGSCRTCSRF